MAEGPILIVAPPTLLRSFIARLFATKGSKVVTCEASWNARVLRDLQPSVVCVDLTLQNAMLEVGSLRRLRRILPNARIVAYTREGGEAIASRAVRGGADSVLGPEATESELLAAAGLQAKSG